MLGLKEANLVVWIWCCNFSSLNQLGNGQIQFIFKKVDNQPYPAWNPLLNHYDREHVMPIITSSVPQMNSAVNVSKINRDLIVKKCAEAYEVCQLIVNGNG